MRANAAFTKGWKLVSALLLAGLLAACGRTALYTDLDEQQANEMMAALMTAGIGADKQPTTTQAGTGWQVRVDDGDFPRAMQVLANYRLPRARHASMCETFKKEGFASSAVEERARYQCSREQDLAETLSGIPGVAEARVHIVLPERDSLGNASSGTSASVTIFERPGANVSDRETDIKAMVKDSVEGLDNPDKVTVKFYSLGTAQGARQAVPSQASVAGFSPLAIAITAGIAVVLALALTFAGRLRSRQARANAAAAQAPNGRVWNG